MTSKKYGYVIGQFFKFLRGHGSKNSNTPEERYVLALAKKRERRKNNPIAAGRPLQKFLKEHPGYAAEHSKNSYIKLKLLYPWRTLIAAAKNRAKTSSLIFSISNTWAESVWTGKCVLTGIPFVSNAYSQKNKRGPHPFAASLDRITPKLGYTEKNCRFILQAMNSFKSSGTDREMREIAKAFLKYRG